MTIPPVQFQRQPRQPSLLERVFADLASGKLRKELIDDPLLEQQSAARERLAILENELIGERQERVARTEAELRLDRDRRLADLARSEAIFGFEIEGMRDRPSDALTSAIKALEGEVGKPDFVDESTITRRSTQGEVIGVLGRVADRQSQNRRSAAIDRDTESRFELFVAQQAQQAPLLWVTDPGTGKVRAADELERAAYTVQTSAAAGQELGLGDASELARLRQIGQDVQSRLVTPPALDAEEIAEDMASIRSGYTSSTGLEDQVKSFVQILKGAGIFKSDSGEDLTRSRQPSKVTDIEMESLVTGAPLRFQGVYFATRVFVRPEDYELFIATAGQRLPPVTEETMQAVWNYQGQDEADLSGQARSADPAPGITNTLSRPRQDDTTAVADTVRRTSPGDTPQSSPVQDAELLLGFNRAATISRLADRFTADPQAYRRRVARLKDVLAVDRGLSDARATATAFSNIQNIVGGSVLGDVNNFSPAERDVIFSRALSILNAALVESRRRRSSSGS